MKSTVSLFVAVGFFLFPLSLLAQSISARDEMDQGVKAFRQAHFEDAIAYFKTAIEADPKLLIARMYLATAYSQQYIPGSDDPENIRIGNLAIEQYKKVIDSTDPAPSNPQRMNSVKGVAGLYLQMKKWDDAKQFYQEASAMDSADPEPHYSIGVIDWTRSYQTRAEVREKLGMKPGNSLIHNASCWQVKSQNELIVKDGIAELTEALKLRPDYDDAMAFLNLMLRERADLQCDDDKASNADLNAADKWIDLNLASKKARIAQPDSGTSAEPQNK